MSDQSASFEIRPLRHSDFPRYRPVVLLAAGELERSTGIDARAEATIDLLNRRSIWFLLGLTRLFGRPIVDTLVATTGNDIQGTGTILWFPKSAYVAGVATKPEWRGRGVASAILGRLEALARRRRREWMLLDVESGNEPAVRVYQKSGYRVTDTFTWLASTGLPPARPVTADGARRVGASEWPELTALLDASRPADYRAAFPARKRVLHHNEVMVHGGRTESATWWRRTDAGAAVVVRAYFVPGARMGAFFPMSTLPEPRAEEFSGILAAAVDWVRSRNPQRCLAVAPEPRGGIAASLEQLGFTGGISSAVMVRPVSR